MKVLEKISKCVLYCLLKITVIVATLYSLWSTLAIFALRLLSLSPEPGYQCCHDLKLGSCLRTDFICCGRREVGGGGGGLIKRVCLFDHIK